MRKNLYSALCAATLLSLTACTADDPFVSNPADGNVIFTVKAPGQLGSRALGDIFGDGGTATSLSYYLYQIEADGPEYIGTGDVVTMQGLKAQVPLNLVTGKTYGIVWLAQAGTTYEYDTDKHTISLDYDKLSLTQNDETRDAFYQYTELKVEGASQQTVELYRPFAQINFGTSDMRAEGVNYAILENAFGENLRNLATELKVKANLPITLDLMQKKALDPKDIEFTFSAAGVPAAQTFPYQPKDAQGNTVSTYDYLAMNYILAGAPEENNVVDLDFTVLNGTTEYNTITVTSAPVKANYRTNIFGQLLTSTVDFNVVIEPIFTDLDNINLDNQVAPGVIYDEEADAYKVYTAEGLVWLSDYSNGKATRASQPLKNQTFVLQADVDLAGIEWTPICSNGEAFQGTFDGNGHTIRNLKASATGKASSGFFANNNIGTIKNLTIENATVTGNYKCGVIAGDGLCGHFDNCHVINSTVISTPHKVNGKWDDANNVGGICGYLSAESGASITNCTVKGTLVSGYRTVGGIVGAVTKNGKTTNLVVTGNKAEDCIVVADQLITDYDGAPRDPVYGEIIGRYVTAVDKEEGNTHSNVKLELVRPSEDGTYAVSTPAALQAVGNLIRNKTSMNGKTITFSGDIDATGVVWQAPWNSQSFVGATIDGNGATISNLEILGGFIPGGAQGGLTVKNLTFKNCHAKKLLPSNGLNGTAIVIGQFYGKCTMENVHVIDCSVEGTFAVGGLIGQFTNEGGQYEANLKNCSVKNTKLTAIGSSQGSWIECPGVGGANAFIGASIVWYSPQNTNTVNLDNCVAEGNTFSNDASVNGGGLWAETLSYDNFSTTVKN